MIFCFPFQYKSSKMKPKAALESFNYGGTVMVLAFSTIFIFARYL